MSSDGQAKGRKNGDDMNEKVTSASLRTPESSRFLKLAPGCAGKHRPCIGKREYPLSLADLLCYVGFVNVFYIYM